MTHAIDVAKYGSNAVGFVVSDRLIIGWVKPKKTGGCSAWVLWDGVTYLAVRRSSDRETAIEMIRFWIEAMTDPELYSARSPLTHPWLDSTSN